MTTNAVQEDLLLWKDEIDKVKEDETVPVGMPLKQYLVQSRFVCKRFELKREVLEQGGMDFKVVASLTSLANVARELLSNQSMVIFPNIASKRAWEKGKEQAEELLYDLKAAMDYAFRDYPELLGQVSAIREGSSNPDLIQDLSDAAVLAESNAALLTEARYDMANAERAAELAKELAELLAQATIDRSTSPENCIIRDKAFTLLKRKMDELIKQAKYIFRADRKTASQFVITPARRKPAKKTEPEPVPEAVPATA
jgi:hypothetical protein